MNIHKFPSPNYFTSNKAIQAVVLHGSSGDAAGGLDWLTNPKSKLSSNYFITKTGTIFELVDFKAGKRAWCNGIVENYDTSIKWLVDAVTTRTNPNLITVSIEHEATEHDMETHASMTDAQFNSSIDLTAWILKTCNLSANHQTIIGHNQISGRNKFFCPGVIFPPAYTEVLIQRYSELG